MIQLALGIIGAVLFSIPFVFYGIMNIGNFTGIVLSAVLIVWGILPEKTADILSLIWSRFVGKILIVILCAAVSLIAVFTVVETACMIHAANIKPDENSTLVVLGCRVYGEKASLMLSERINAAYIYLTEHSDTPCVLSGGKGDDEGISEAECMRRELLLKGISPDRLYMEDRSTSTRENLSFSLEIIKENSLPENIAIVTNEFHCYRAGRVAKSVGIDYSCVPAHTALWLLPTYYVRDLYGILYEWFL